MRPLEGLGGGGVGCTYGHMDVRREDLPHCVVQDCVPFRAAAPKKRDSEGGDSEGGRLGKGGLGGGLGIWRLIKGETRKGGDS